MALVFRHSAEEPARCALEIAEALPKRPDLPLRMGIHRRKAWRLLPARREHA